MAIILPNEKLVLNAYAVLVGETPGNAALEEHLAYIAANGTEAYTAVLNSIFADQSNATLATTMLANLGLSSIFTQAEAEAFLAGNAANRVGAMINLSNALYNYSGTDTAIVAAHDAYVNAIEGSYNYSIDPSHVAGADLSGDIVSGGQTLTLTTGIDTVAGTAGNDTILGSVDSTTGGVTTYNPGDSVNGGEGIDTLKITVSHTTSNMLDILGGDITNVENLTIKAYELASADHLNQLNIVNGTFAQVTVDYSNTFFGADSSDSMYVEGVGAQATLVVQNIKGADDESFYRNDSGTWDATAGTVSTTNTIQNINLSGDAYSALAGQTYDWFFYGYENFTNATTINHTLNVSNVNGADSDSYDGYGIGVYDYVTSATDGSVINSTVNITNVDGSGSGDMAGDVEVIADNTVGTSTFNVVANITDAHVPQFVYDVGTISSDADTVTLNLSNIADDSGTSNVAYIEVNAFETVNINVTGDTELDYIDTNSNVDAAQTINIVASADFTVSNYLDEADDQAVTVNISGAGNVSISFYGDNYGETVNAGTATGNLTLEVGSDATYATVVTAGSGDDHITLLNAFELNADGDAFLQVLDGGAGTDTFGIDAADLVTSLALLGSTADAPTDFSDAVKNFEALSLTGFTNQDIDATALGFNTVTIDGYSVGGGSLTVADAAMVTVTGTGATGAEIIVDGAATGDQSLTLTVDGADGIDLAALTVSDVETISVVSSASAPDDTTPGANGLELLATEAVTLNISGATELDMTGSSFANLETVNAAGFDAGLTIDVSAAGQAVEVTTGDGADSIVGSDYADTISVGNGGNTVQGGLGLDTITLGSGATADDVDTIVFGAVADSQGTTVDVINGFQVAVQATTDTNADDVVDATDIINDVLDFSALALASHAYLGEANGYGAVLTSLTGTIGDAVLDKSTSTLYIDVDGSGTLDNADMAINLVGVTDLSADNFVWA